jgi:hypothetical protein
MPASKIAEEFAVRAPRHRYYIGDHFQAKNARLSNFTPPFAARAHVEEHPGALCLPAHKALSVPATKDPGVAPGPMPGCLFYTTICCARPHRGTEQRTPLKGLTSGNECQAQTCAWLNVAAAEMMMILVIAETCIVLNGDSSLKSKSTTVVLACAVSY